MQAGSWNPPAGVLGELCESARERARSLDAAALERASRNAPAAPGFEVALKGAHLAVIAELKRRSPSKGALNDSMDAGLRGAAYESGGAAALSVLTEPSRFGGSLDDLSMARRVTRIPVLKKDFHLTREQVWEGKAAGASALLFIVRALGPVGLRQLMEEARIAGVEALVEVRSARELDWALECGASIIGVNCRDLETLVIEPRVHATLLPTIPPGCVAIAESGIESAADMERLAGLGADAVLVGSLLSRATDATGAVRALASVERRARP